MKAKKNAKTGLYDLQYYYTDWQGNRKQSTKRGFKTKHEAEEWLEAFKLSNEGNLDMTFGDFVSIYKKNIQSRIRASTFKTKEHILDVKIIPYFKDKRMCDIKPSDVIKWQNEMINSIGKNGKPYTETYLKTIHNQLSAVFNYAVKYYNLKQNPAAIAGSIGSKEADEMQFWTKEEYLRFSDAMMDKPVAYYAFEMLYWCGIRIGELFALTRADFDLKNKTLRINKSYQRIDRKDVITKPKTPKSNRIVKMPEFLCEEMSDYFSSIYELKSNTRIFMISKSFLEKEMKRGCKETGVKKIRIHDLRHSHISLLIDEGFSAVAIADRVGHRSLDITFRYAHLFPTRQDEMAERLNIERRTQNV